MLDTSRICVLGPRGLVGSALVRRLRQQGFQQLLTPTRSQLDLRDQARVNDYFAAHRPEYIFMAAGTVGGILANSTRPGEFIYDNIMMGSNVLAAALAHKVRKVLLLGSSCIYPRLAPQPLREESLLSGPLESTNEAYAVAKIAVLKMGQAFRRQYGLDAISAMPTNLYGPEDNFDDTSSHVLPGLMHRFHRARLTGAPQVQVWGTGRARREFLYVDDLAEALVFLMHSYSHEDIVNVGTGQDISIAELAQQIRAVVGYPGELVFDPDKPDGTPVKVCDVSRLQALGWKAQVDLAEGLRRTYRWYQAQPSVAHAPE